jgi:serine/threonine protein kinase
MHSHEVLHRDLKPGNILVCEGGWLKLADFGLTKKRDPNGLTDKHCGTMGYVAPEVNPDLNP